MRILSALCLLAAACAPNLEVTMINPAPRPMARRAPEQVELFTTQAPARSYVEVAVITASAGKADQHLAALRTKGAELGCDALVVTVMPRESTIRVVNHDPSMIGKPGRYAHGESVDSSSATCIVYTPTSARR